MKLFEGKCGVVLGIANDHSLAWAITKELQAHGAEMGFTHLPDRDPKYRRMERRVRKLVDPFARFVVPCEVRNDEHLDRLFDTAKQTFGQIDFVVHSIAYAPVHDLKEPTYNVSREGFLLAMEISVYSLLAIARRAKDIMKPGGSILTLTYLGGERVVPGYNLMGLCKAALERAVGYLASELGPSHRIRVNALSAGPVRTAAASAVGEFDLMMQLYQGMAPLRRNITPDEVARAGLFLLSDLAAGITGEVIHVDAGYHAMGAPPPDFSMDPRDSS